MIFPYDCNMRLAHVICMSTTQIVLAKSGAQHLHDSRQNTKNVVDYETVRQVKNPTTVVATIKMLE